MTTPLSRAMARATAAHAGQVRDGLGEPYILHPLRVSLLAQAVGLPDDAIIAGVLHDVKENGGVTDASLRADGFSDRTVHLVGLLSKGWTSRDPEAARHMAAYYARIASDPDALTLKFLDRIDNLRDMTRAVPLGDPKIARWAARYAGKTEAEFLPLLTPALPPSVVRWFTAALADLKTTLSPPAGTNMASSSSK